MARNLKPLGDRVVVEPIEPDTMTASGLVLPETAKEKPQRGTVVAIGPGGRNEQGLRIPLDVSAGDTVLFAKYAGTEFKIDSQKLVILKENDLLAVILNGADPKKKK
jgi:chaperonin GroES